MNYKIFLLFYQCNLKVCKKHSNKSMHRRTPNVTFAKIKNPINNLEKIYFV